MQVSHAAIFTLATLASGNITKQSLASTSKTPNQVSSVHDVAIPVAENTPTPIKIIAHPETIVAQQFSQNSPIVHSGVSNKYTLPPAFNRTDNNLVVTATSVQIVGASQELQEVIRQAIKTQVGGNTSLNQLHNDVKTILDTGLFANARFQTEDTPNGFNIVYYVQPVIVRGLQLSGAQILNYKVVDDTFKSEMGKNISPAALKSSVDQINKWYADNGYTLARVLSIQPSPQGILTIKVAEGIVGDIKFRFVNDKGETVNDKGKPVTGRTKPSFLLSQVKLKPGEVFNNNLVKQDLQQLYKLGLFDSVNLGLEGDANKVDLVYQLREVGARSINLGGNYNADRGIIGTLNYNDRNIGGINNSFNLNLGVSTHDFDFDSKFINPYRPTNPDELGYSIDAFRHRDISDTFDGNITLANGDKIREGRFGGGIDFQRPLDGWDTSIGLNYTRTSIRDRAGNLATVDEKGDPLSFSGTGIDDLTTVSFTASKDLRDNPLNPTKGSVVSLSTEQSIPLGLGNISMNRLQVNYSQYLPLKLYASQDPQVFAVNLQAGTVIGDLPPYQTFNLGGLNSVRGYSSGDVGSGRSYVQASAEYRFPIVNVLGGVFFADFASDLDSGKTVLGDPAGVRGKPGAGFGYGAGLRLNSPLGLLRADYGITDQGESRVQFGIGQRF